MRKKLYKISIIKANVFSIVVLIISVIVYGIPYYLLWGKGLTKQLNFDTFQPKSIFLYSWVNLFVLIIGIIVHELAHGITWSLFTKNGFKSIKFGIIWKMLTPYCHCEEPLRAKHYRLGAIMPFIILGLIPYVVSLLFGSVSLFIFAILFTATASGDFLMIYKLRIAEPNQYVQDHPSEVGFYIFEN